MSLTECGCVEGRHVVTVASVCERVDRCVSGFVNVENFIPAVMAVSF
jgi:hypothetical protein